jgi:hypothetical protein
MLRCNTPRPRIVPNIIGTIRQMNDKNTVETAATRVIDLEAELENAAEANIGGDSLITARAELHKWVDSVVGVVASPGVGRVTLIHANGLESRIASPELPFLLSKPVSFD